MKKGNNVWIFHQILLPLFDETLNTTPIIYSKTVIIMFYMR